MSHPDADAPWRERRFSQAVAEGDGISIIPVLRGSADILAAAAESAGAEAVLVESVADARAARDATELPVMLRPVDPTASSLDEARAVGVDAVELSADAVIADPGAAYAHAADLGLDCALSVVDEDQLQTVLESLQPEILAVAPRGNGGTEAFDSTLAILRDVPAGMLVIVDAEARGRDDVASLERAGVDALIVDGPDNGDDLAALVRRLIGAENPLD